MLNENRSLLLGDEPSPLHFGFQAALCNAILPRLPSRSTTHKKGSLKTTISVFRLPYELRTAYFFNSAKISSTVPLASPKHITVFSLKNSGFCTPA